MSTYKAWDGNDYPSPAPAGWYHASDDLWWPEGYGPGPAAVPTVEPIPPPAPAPPPQPNFEPQGFESPSAESPGDSMPDYESPRAESPTFDRDPTTVMPISTVFPNADGGAIPGHSMPAPGSDAPAPSPFGVPTTDQWSQAPVGAAPPGAAPPGSAPPGAAPPGSDIPATGGSSNKGLLIAGAALLALVVVAGVAFVLTRSSDGDDAVAFDPTAAKGSAANPHDAGDLVRISYDDPDSGERIEWTIEALEAPADSSSDGGDDADATVPLRVALTESSDLENLSLLSFKAVSSDGKRTSIGECGPLTSPLPSDRAVSVDETVEGQVCWQVPTADLATITMMIEVDGIDGAVHMKLQ